jgi:hypothetical protein
MNDLPRFYFGACFDFLTGMIGRRPRKRRRSANRAVAARRPMSLMRQNSPCPLVGMAYEKKRRVLP